MADSARENIQPATLIEQPLLSHGVRSERLRYWGLVVATLTAVGIVLLVALNFQVMELRNPLWTSSTPGQLAAWMSEISAEPEQESIVGGVARNWALQLGQESLDENIIFQAMRTALVVFAGLVALVTLVGVVGLVKNARWSRTVLMLGLLGLDVLIFIVPVLDQDSTLPLVFIGIALLLIVLLFAPGRVTKLLGFVVVLSALLVAWEALKSFAATNDYRITLPQPGWTYTSYSTLDDSLAALQAGHVVAMIADSNDLEDLIAPAGDDDAEDSAYPGLRLLSNIQTDMHGIAGMRIEPDFPGRLAVAVRAVDASQWQSVSELVGQPLGAVEGDFSVENLLAVPRRLVLVDLTIGNDLNLPHLQNIAVALLQPARRNGPMLLLGILFDAALYTWSEAAIGFLSGAILGFLLGALFAHSPLMQRGLLPYVVMSQTVPILALAPMVVIWLGANSASVAVISAYLTFFPVTINTLRGLTSPHPNALELMRSYAASKWTVMWKLRFPAALPYIFTALKVSATASVVGAIIGELPSGIREGLGGAILNFNQYYTSDPAKLWAAILIAALVGIVFFVLVSVIERLTLRGTRQTV
jgi:NitT/TauT family transport system permease protein